ncbi:MAG: nucleoside deaminase [Desulfosalsimonadaceae bacterium]|nr:nucleoside deaminase [Desulfosalsimonadaceae bacterium]
MNDVWFMEQALIQAEYAFSAGEFPVGCVIADQTKILAVGSRQGTAGGQANETDHAEMVALRRMADAAGGETAGPLSVFCTMEPCLMCFGAILISGIHRIVYAYEDVMGGGTRCDLSRLPALYSGAPVRIVPYVMRDRSLALFKAFFSRPDNLYWKHSVLADYTLAQPL